MARLSHHTEEARNYVGDNLKWGKSFSTESSVLFIDLYHMNCFKIYLRCE